MRVRLEVGVEQEERNPAHLGAPYGDAHVTRADRSFDLHAVDLADGQVGATVLRVHLELAAARVDVLSPEALPVEQPDRDQRQSQVAGRLQVVTREYSEPAGIDRQAL